MNVNVAERVTDVEGGAFEGEIREFIRKDMAPAHPAAINSESGRASVIQPQRTGRPLRSSMVFAA